MESFSSDHIELLLSINRTLSSSRDTPANVRSAIESVSNDLGLRHAFLLMFDSESDSFSIAAAVGLSVAEFRRIETRAEKSVFGRAMKLSAPVTIKSVASEPALDYLNPESPDVGLVAVPVTLHDQAIGLLAGATDPDRMNGNEELEQLFKLIASMIGQTLRIDRAVRGERQKLMNENSQLKQELKERYDFSHIIGRSNPMKLVYEQVTQVAKSNATVLIRGESGTGKEMIANAIHYNSLRSKRPFVKINCAALPETLIESELFGHEKGAFTGADRFKKGRFELADGGTLFLDEIGDLLIQTQIKLLRVLQEREFERLGGSETMKTNIRLITATNKNLEQAIADGQFREDLYYRLNVFTIFLPPLRERKSDILLLAEHFLEKYEVEYGKRIRRISTPAIDMLMSYHFPGNVRELENAIERAVLVCDSNVIHGHHLPLTLQTAEVSGTVTDLSLASAVAAFERDMIQDALKSSKGNIARAARALAATERILGYKIKKYGIDTMRFRR
jgi:Nif-specific regulatory protein